MPSLFIANCSKATHLFQFMPKGVNKLVTLTIKPGKQVSIRDKPREELEAALKPQLKYGYVEAREVMANKNFSGICYNFDHPISRDGIEEYADHRNDVIDGKSQEIRRETTQAIDEKLTDEAQRMGLGIVKTELVIEETPGREHEGKNARSPVKQTLVVERGAVENRPKKRARK